MKHEKKFITRLAFYFVGLIVMTLGVVISVKSDLGVTPISSIPYTMTVVTGMDLGIATMLFSVLMVLVQIIILRKKFKPVNLLQLPIGILFGMFLTVCGKLMAQVPVPENFVFKFILMLVSTVLVALGVFLYVAPRFVPLAPEGFIIAVTQVTKLSFSTVKVIFDVAMVAVSIVTCLIAVHSLGSVGIGTIAAAILVGNEVKLLTKFFGGWRDHVLGIRPKELHAPADSQTRTADG